MTKPNEFYEFRRRQGEKERRRRIVVRVLDALALTLLAMGVFVMKMIFY